MSNVLKWGAIVVIAIFVLKHPAEAGAMISNAARSLSTLISSL